MATEASRNLPGGQPGRKFPEQPRVWWEETGGLWCGARSCQGGRYLHPRGARSVYQVDELEKGILGRGDGEF